MKSSTDIISADEIIDNVAQEILRHYPTEYNLRHLLLRHSAEVAALSLTVAAAHPELHADRDFLLEAALLHDIGVADCDAPSIYCHGQLPYICHGVAGRQRLDRCSMPRHALVCERHTGSGLTCEEITARNMPLPHRDMLPISTEEKIICYADKFYSKSGDPTKRKSLAAVIKSMARHGRAPLQRFLALHNQFAI